MTGREASQRTYPGPRHERDAPRHVASRARSPTKMAQHAKINTHFTALFAAFLAKLRASPEADGSVLDHSLIAFGTGMSDGQAHNSIRCRSRSSAAPAAACAAIASSSRPSGRSIANLWLGVAGMFGSPLETLRREHGSARDLTRVTFARLLLSRCVASAAAFAAAAPRLRRSSQPRRTAHHEAAIALVAGGADVNAAEADGTTALHWAVRAGDTELVELLLGAGADGDCGQPLRRDAAAARGRERRRRAHATRCSLPAPTRTPRLPEGETVLMTAARTGSSKRCSVLLEHGADIDARERWYGEIALIWAAAENHADAVRMLLEHGADVDSPLGARSRREQRRAGQSILPLGNWTPLMYAAREDALAARPALVAAGAEPRSRRPRRRDGARRSRSSTRTTSSPRMLLDAGADPNVVDNDAGMGPLYAAVDMHRLAIGHGRPNPAPVGTLDAVGVVQQLLEHGADPNARLEEADHAAPSHGRRRRARRGRDAASCAPRNPATSSVMRLLLAAGADPRLTMPNGATALMFAAGLGWRNGSAAGAVLRSRLRGRSRRSDRAVARARARPSTQRTTPATPRCTRPSPAAARPRSSRRCSRAAPIRSTANAKGERR